MKKLICTFLITLIALAALPIAVHAAGQSNATLTLEQADKCVGNRVEVKVNLSNNPGIISANLKVSFSSNLKLVAADNGSVFSTLTYIPPKALSSGIAITSESNFAWSGFDIQSSDIKNGTILTLHFEIVKGSSSSYQVSVQSESGDVIDKNMNPILLNATKKISTSYHTGSTTIKNKKGATTSADGYTGDVYCKSCNTRLSKGKTIYKIKSVSLSSTLYRYDGKTKKPSVTVKDSKNKKLTLNTDYTVSYSSGCKKAGTYRATITFKGSYSGSKALSFTIYDDLSAPSKVTATLYGYDDVKVSWKAVSKAKAYKVYYKKSTDKAYTYKGVTTKTSMKVANLADGVKYTFKVVPCVYVNKTYYEDNNSKTTNIYTLKTPSTPSVSKASSKKVKISWKDISGEGGYEISASTSKSKAGIIYRTTSKSKTITVARNKTYYYKVRAYVVVDGKRIYTAWSSIKSYKLK